MAEMGIGEIKKLRRALANPGTLMRQGVSEQWIERCRLLVMEYDRLQKQFDELEAEIESSGDNSSSDTIVM